MCVYILYNICVYYLNCGGHTRTRTHTHHAHTHTHTPRTHTPRTHTHTHTHTMCNSIILNNFFILNDAPDVNILLHITIYYYILL